MFDSKSYQDDWSPANQSSNTATNTVGDLGTEKKDVEDAIQSEDDNFHHFDGSKADVSEDVADKYEEVSKDEPEKNPPDGGDETDHEKLDEESSELFGDKDKKDDEISDDPWQKLINGARSGTPEETEKEEPEEDDNPPAGGEEKPELDEEYHQSTSSSNANLEELLKKKSADAIEKLEDRKKEKEKEKSKVEDEISEIDSKIKELNNLTDELKDKLKEFDSELENA